jgi:hypothetical protein
LACPLHILQDSDSGVREAPRIMSRNHRENEEEDEGIQSENDEESGLAFQGPFCDCQVEKLMIFPSINCSQFIKEITISINQNLIVCFDLFIKTVETLTLTPKILP